MQPERAVVGLLVATAVVVGCGGESDSTGPLPQGPDELLVYTQLSGQQRDLYLMNADGSEKTRIPNVPSGPHQASISPDGARVLFTADSDLSGRDIYTIRLDGTDLRQLTRDSNWDCCASWSPDGSQIIFSSDRAGSTDDLWVSSMSWQFLPSTMCWQLSPSLADAIARA